MNWYKRAHLTKIANEYWFIDGTSVFADGDIGDINHEGYVAEYLASQYDLPFIPHFAGKSELISWALENTDEVIAHARANCGWNPQWDQLIKTRNYQKLFDEMVYDGCLDENTLYDHFNVPDAMKPLLQMQGDLRDYAIKELGWQRVKGNVIQAFRPTPETLRSIRGGIDETSGHGDDDEDNEPTYDLEFSSNGSYFESVPYSVIAKCQPTALLPYRTRAAGRWLVR